MTNIVYIIMYSIARVYAILYIYIYFFFVTSYMYLDVPYPGMYPGMRVCTLYPPPRGMLSIYPGAQGMAR